MGTSTTKYKKIIRPNKGFQEKFVRSNIDVVIGGGVLSCGKTSGAVLMCAEPSLDPNFRAVFLRNNLGDLKSGGGVLDEFKSMYRKGCSVLESGEPRVDFPSGAKIDVTHIADQTRSKVRQRFKGRQYDLIYFDEMTGFTWECFQEVATRNRGMGKWTGKIRGTTNPERDHWLRTFLDWYIGLDGFIREDREGVVRYFYINGEKVEDVVWGDSKEEVYQKCKIQIDKKLKKVNSKDKQQFTYENMIRSFTFYLGRMSENTATIENNNGYVGAVAMSGGKSSEQLLEGNWNVSNQEEENLPIPSEVANFVFVNDEQRNGDRWITCDLADEGTDNFVALVWDGFHVYDKLVLNKTTPKQNAERLLQLAEKHGIGNSHIIFDGVHGIYIKDYIPDSIAYIGNSRPKGLYARSARYLKDECFLRLCECLNGQLISVSSTIADSIYEHQRLKTQVTVQNEFLEECAVVRFKELPSGKKALFTKKEMNAKLGKGRSMDLLDPFAMRMLPVLDRPYGEELYSLNDENEEENNQTEENTNIFNNSFWGIS